MTAIIGGFQGKTLTLLGKVKYSAGGSASLNIFQDIVAKEFIIVANGKIKANYTGTGTSTKPLVNAYGVLNGIIDELTLSRRGTDRVRQYNGTRQLVTTCERMFGEAEGSLYGDNNLSNAKVGLLEFGATGDNIAFRESVTIMMENKLSGTWFPTLFNTRNLQTAKLNFKFAELENVISKEDTSTATIEGDIELSVYASCCDYLLDSPDLNKADWTQTFEELEFSGVQSNSRHRITPQGMLQGMLITGLHSEGKAFNHENMEKTHIEIKYMGIQVVEGTLAALQEVDNVKTHLRSRRKGSVYVSFLNNDAFNSGLFIAEGKQLELIISTDSGLSYTQPVKLRFEYDQIIFAPTAPAEIK